MDSIPVSGRSLGGGDGNLLQYSCLGNLMDRGTWQPIAHWSCNESDTTERLTTAFNWLKKKKTTLTDLEGLLWGHTNLELMS